MPTYSYSCSRKWCKYHEGAGNTFDLIRKITENVGTAECLECKEPAYQVIQMASKHQNFQLKGPDWPGQSIKKFKIFDDD